MMKWARWGLWNPREHIFLLQREAATKFQAYAAMWQ